MCLGQVKHTGGKQQGRSGTAATAHPAKRPRLGSASASAAPQTQPLPELATGIGVVRAIQRPAPAVLEAEAWKAARRKGMKLSLTLGRHPAF